MHQKLQKNRIFDKLLKCGIYLNLPLMLTILIHTSWGKNCKLFYSRKNNKIARKCDTVYLNQLYHQWFRNLHA